MTAPHANQIIDEYMTRLEGALAPVADTRRRELMDEVRSHITEARSRLTNETDTDLLDILDRLGDPAETAAAEIGRIDVSPVQPRGRRVLEIAAIVLVPLLWPVGVILLWISERWTTRDKLIGTLVAPGGYIGTILVGAVMSWGAISPVCRTVSDASGRVLSSTCPSGGVQIGINVAAALLLLLYIVGPVLTAGYLALRLQRKSPELERDGYGARLGVPSS